MAKAGKRQAVIELQQHIKFMESAQCIQEVKLRDIDRKEGTQHICNLHDAGFPLATMSKLRWAHRMCDEYSAGGQFRQWAICWRQWLLPSDPEEWNPRAPAMSSFIAKEIAACPNEDAQLKLTKAASGVIAQTFLCDYLFGLALDPTDEHLTIILNWSTLVLDLFADTGERDGTYDQVMAVESLAVSINAIRSVAHGFVRLLSTDPRYYTEPTTDVTYLTKKFKPIEEKEHHPSVRVLRVALQSKENKV